MIPKSVEDQHGTGLLLKIHNSSKLRNVFRSIDFNSNVDFGTDIKAKMRPSATCWKTSTDLTCVLPHWMALTSSVTPTNI